MKDIYVTGTGRCGTGLAAKVFDLGHETCTPPSVQLEQWSVGPVSSWLLLPWMERFGRPPNAVVIGLRREEEPCVASLEATTFGRQKAWYRFARYFAESDNARDWYHEWNARLDVFVDFWVESEELFRGREVVNGGGASDTVRGPWN